MVPLARRIMLKQRTRYLITIGGVGVTIWLILFLFAVHAGVKRGATAYVAASPADLWVCQQNSTNLLRSSSFLPVTLAEGLRQTPGVAEVTGILRVLATTEIRGRRKTLFVVGFEPDSPLGAPPGPAAGAAPLRRGEMVLDAAFAHRHRLAVGDGLQVQGAAFRIAGISAETNALVAQFAFVPRADAERLLALPGVVSFYLLKAQPGADLAAIGAAIRARFGPLAVFTRPAFIANNIEEMESGILPVLWTISLLGVLIGGAVITLMLYGAVLEKRDDYAVLKALGAQQGFLAAVVLQQSLAVAVLGFAVGVLLNGLASPLLRQAVPELSLQFTPAAALGVFAAALVIAALGAWAPLLKLKHIYPAEVFRA